MNKGGCEGMSVDEESTVVVSSSSSAMTVEDVAVTTRAVSLEADTSVGSASTVDVGSVIGD